MPSDGGVKSEPQMDCNLNVFKLQLCVDKNLLRRERLSERSTKVYATRP